jgi:ABC-2 type transport system permease protein
MIKEIFRIAGRETGRIFSGKTYWFCMFFIPLFSCLFFLSLMREGLPVELPIAVVDEDNTSNSRSLLRQLDLFEGVKIAQQYPNFYMAQTELQKGNVYGIFCIPADFTKKAASGKQPVLTFYTNNSYMVAGSLVFKEMKTIATLASASVILQTGKAKGYSEQQIMANIQPVAIDTHPIGNPWLNYSVYLNNLIIPGMLALMIMCVTVYSIGIEIKDKTVRKWLQPDTNSLTVALIGKLIPQTILFSIVGMLIYAILYVLMQFPMNGNIVNMLVALFLLIISSQSLGVFMIGCFPTLRLGLSFSCIFGMLAFSISGFSFPVNAMYPPIQVLSNVFPLRHYFLIYVDQALNGRAPVYSLLNYVALLAFLILPVFILRNLKWSLKNTPYKT